MLAADGDPTSACPTTITAAVAAWIAAHMTTTYIASVSVIFGLYLW